MKESDKKLLCKLLRSPYVHSTAGLRGDEVASCRRLADEVEGIVPASRQRPQERQPPGGQPAAPSDDTQPSE